MTHDCDATTAAPYWIAPERCRCEVDVEFLPNRALAFVNSGGAHGAEIPADVEPRHCQRYTYQFRVGPTRCSLAALRATLPPEEQARWGGGETAL